MIASSIKPLALAGIFTLWATLVFAGHTIVGQVVDVVDGDILQVKTRDGLQTIRLADIDCPEPDQPYGDQAASLSKDLAKGQTVAVLVKGVDPFRRTKGEVILSGGESLNCRLVSAGLAWRETDSSNTVVRALETEAQSAKAGLWQDSNPEPPWLHRKKAGEKTPVESLSIAIPAHRGRITAPSRGVSAAIRARAARDWPGDYDMQQYVIRMQERSYMNVQNHRSNIPASVQEQIKADAARRWPGDYDMQEYVINKQTQAYQAINH